MASRDRYKRPIKCPLCGEKGTLHLSENDYDFMTKFDRNIDFIEGSFDAKMLHDTQITILCKKCGHEFS